MILQRRQEWFCPRCTFTDVTLQHLPHTRFHNCSGLGGLSAPMQPAGVKCKVEVVEREDYIGKELVQLANGRPVMNVVTTRDDGTDCAVYAPTAKARRD